MKMSRVFIALMICFFGLLVIVDVALPRTFNWDETYAHTSDDPFGCKFYDEVMSQSTKHGYAVSHLTLSQWSMKDTCRMTYLIVGDREEFSTKALDKVLKRGDNVVIVQSCLDYETRTHLDVNANSASFSLYEAQTYPDERVQMSWMGDNPASYSIPLAMKGGYFSSWDKNYKVLVDRTTDATDTYYKRNGKKLFGRIPSTLIGKKDKGTLVLCSCPFLFTNYAVRNESMLNLSMRIMSQVAQYPIVRLDHTLVAPAIPEEVSNSSFRAFLMHPPLRWALYLAFFTLILGMLFTARRRQRVIPVIAPPVNHNMAMVRHIGTLYFSRHDHLDLLSKKYLYMADELRRRAMVDIDDDDHIDAELDVLSQLTGIPRDELKGTIRSVKAMINSGEQITTRQLHQSIDAMNKIMSNLL